MTTTSQAAAGTAAGASGAPGGPGGTAVAAIVVRVRAHRFASVSRAGFEAPDHRGDFDEHVRTYEVAGPAEALTEFVASFPEMVPVLGEWHLEVFVPSAAPRPERRLLNWEKDPDAEVADGWLSNIAAAGNSLADLLEWQPRFCPHAHTVISCPGCGGQLATRWSKWGGFYSCGSCGWKTGLATRKGRAAQATTQITGWCGTRLEVRYNSNGVPYPGCPSCDPAYECPTVNEVYHGRRSTR